MTSTPTSAWTSGTARTRSSATETAYFANLPQQPRRRGAWEHLELPRHECARAPGGVGGLSAGLPADPAVRVVDLARRSTPDGSQLTLPGAVGNSSRADRPRHRVEHAPSYAD